MINKIKLTSALVLKLRTGIDEKGNPLYKNISFKRVKPEALEQDIFDVAQGIISLMQGTVEGLYRQDLDELVSE